MATWADVRRIVSDLPETHEPAENSWKFRDKALAWERPLRRQDLEALGDAAPDGPILCVRTTDVGVKEALVADDPDVYFTTPHFDGYPAVLIRLERIDRDELRELIVEAWALRAPKRMRDAYQP
jgi:hypothetical protein